MEFAGSPLTCSEKVHCLRSIDLHFGAKEMEKKNVIYMNRCLTNHTVSNSGSTKMSLITIKK